MNQKYLDFRNQRLNTGPRYWASMGQREPAQYKVNSLDQVTEVSKKPEWRLGLRDVVQFSSFHFM